MISNIVSIFIFNPLLCFFVSVADPAKRPYISVSFGSNDLYNIFIALLIILISWIMTETCKINEEQELTV